MLNEDDGSSATTRGSMTASTGQKSQGLSERIKKIKMFSAIQKKLKLTSTAHDAFQKMDNGFGFLTIKDMQAQMPA